MMFILFFYFYSSSFTFIVMYQLCRLWQINVFNIVQNSLFSDCRKVSTVSPVDSCRKDELAKSRDIILSRYVVSDSNHTGLLLDRYRVKD